MNILITGGARGIGAETARRLAARGDRVAILDRDGDAARATAQQLGPGHVAVQADVRDSAAVKAAVDEAAAQLGGLDVVVANAGIGEAGTVAVREIEALLRTIDINLSGVVRTVHAALPHLIERQGYVLLVSSAAALKNVPGGACYAAAKAGVEWFGGALRLEVAHQGVAVGVAHPAWVRTDMYADQMALPAVGEAIGKLPWPFSAVSSVEACADAFVGAIDRRKRKVYVPRALAYLDKVRGVFTGALWDRILIPRVAASIPAIEAEVAARQEAEALAERAPLAGRKA